MADGNPHSPARRLLRPANFPQGLPGWGVYEGQKNNVGYAVVNLQGRIFMGSSDDPFRYADRPVSYTHLKGSADAAINALTSDTIVALEREPNLQVERAPGTVLSYLAFNLRDPILHDVRVRQAIAYAIDRGPLLQYIWRGFAEPALSVLPPQSWAYDPDVAAYPHNPEKARQMLDAAGYRARDGVRFHLTMKTSTEERCV